MSTKQSAPFRTKIASPEFYAQLDPGIRFAVRVLHAYGIETGQSCEGGPGHCYDWPTVDLGGTPRKSAEGFAALHYLSEFGLPVRDVSYHWDITDGQPYDSFWRITFSKPMPERADEPLMFVTGAQGQPMPWDKKANALPPVRKR